MGPRRQARRYKDAIRKNKGYHINTDVPGAELMLRPEGKDTIVISPMGSVKVDAGKYVGAVAALLQGQGKKMDAQLNGIIRLKPNSWQAREAEAMLKILQSNSGFTVKAQQK